MVEGSTAVTDKTIRINELVREFGQLYQRQI